MFTRILDGYSNLEKSIISVCAVGVLIFLALMQFDTQGWFSKQNLKQQPAIGFIELSQNDIRLKERESFAWFNAKKKQKIRLGDSLFSGEGSSALVELDGLGSLSIGEKSLVVFTQVRDEKIVNFQEGNFRISFEGKVVVAVKDEVISLDGQKSEVQIFLSKNRAPRMKLLKGKADIVKREPLAAKAMTRRTPAAASVIVLENDLNPPETLAESEPLQAPQEAESSAPLEVVDSPALLEALELPSLPPEETPLEFVVNETLPEPAAQPLPPRLRKKKMQMPIVVQKEIAAQEKRNLPPLALSAQRPKKIARREMATTENISTKLVEERRTNDRFSSSKISVQYFTKSLITSQQIVTSASTINSQGLGLGGIYWKRRHGFEGKAIIGLASSGPGGGSQNLEARYHYRYLSSTPSGIFRRIQAALVGGFESSQNSNALASPKYELAKVGATLSFPWLNRFSLQMEYFYGIGTDSSSKQEFFGHMNYFLNEDWGIKAGYQVHYFTSGSASTSPGGQLPFREGASEFYSGFDYYF